MKLRLGKPRAPGAARFFGGGHHALGGQPGGFWKGSYSRNFRGSTIWLFKSSPWYRWPIEIGGLPINSMVIFHGELLNNHRVQIFL